MTWHSPLLIYNLVHDGSFEHPAILQKAGEKMIAGQPHIDNALHSLRCALALNQVNTDNGPTVVFEKSMHLKNIKEAHKNLLLNDFDFDTGSNSSHNINQQDLDLLNNQSKSIEVTCKKGDLILVDLKNAHYQKILKQGQRHLLWYYN
jgi:ectoine hydroxylase-related dioxygenase (phytanoyl-CoA dioxygenase family)